MLLSLLFSLSGPHTCIYASVCVYVSVEFFDDSWLRNHCNSFQDFCSLLFFDIFASDIIGCFQLVDWESKTIFMLLISKISFFWFCGVFLLNLLRFLQVLLLCFLLPVCILDVRDGHSQELLLLVNVNKMSNVLQSLAKSGHMIFLSWKFLQNSSTANANKLYPKMIFKQ